MKPNPLENLYKTIGWAIAALLLAHLITLILQVIPAPYPLEYAEGLMAWGTKQILEGKWPYGDIEAIPSRYFTYGPFVPTVAAAISLAIPDSNPLQFVQAGRILAILSTILTAVFLGAACKSSKLTIATLLIIWITSLAASWPWMYRIDPTLCALLAALILTLSKNKTKFHTPILCALSTALALTKPTTVLDIPSMCLLACWLKNQAPREFLKDQWKPLLKAGAFGLAAFATMTTLSGGFMAENILLNHKGLALPLEYRHSILYSVRVIEALPLTLFLLFSLGALLYSKDPQSYLGPIALGVSFFITGTLNLKSGADVNYQFPTWMIALCLIAKTIQSSRHASLLACSALGFISWSLAANQSYSDFIPSLIPGSHYNAPTKIAQAQETQERFEAITALHNKPNFLSEDIFYSVAANQEPLVTDIFQTIQVYAHKGKSTFPIFEQASGAWGETRLGKLLAGAQEPQWAGASFPASQEIGTKKRFLGKAWYFEKKDLAPMQNPRENDQTISFGPNTPAPKDMPLDPLLLQLYLLHCVIPSLSLLCLGYHLSKEPC